MEALGHNGVVVETLILVPTTATSHWTHPMSLWQLKRVLERSSDDAYRIGEGRVWLGDELFTQLHRVPLAQETSTTLNEFGSVLEWTAFHGVLDMTALYVPDLAALLTQLLVATSVIPGARARAVTHYLDAQREWNPLTQRPEQRGAGVSENLLKTLFDDVIHGKRTKHLFIEQLTPLSSCMDKMDNPFCAKPLTERLWETPLWIQEGKVFASPKQLLNTSAPGDKSSFHIGHLRNAVNEHPMLASAELRPIPILSELCGEKLAEWTTEVLPDKDVYRHVTLLLPPALALALHDVFSGTPEPYRGTAHHRSALLHAAIRYHTLEEPLMPQPLAQTQPGSFFLPESTHPLANGQKPSSPPCPPFVIPGVTAGLSPMEQLDVAYNESDNLARIFEDFDSLLRSGRYLRCRLPLVHCIAFQRLMEPLEHMSALVREFTNPTRRAADVPGMWDLGDATTAGGGNALTDLGYTGVDSDGRALRKYKGMSDEAFIGMMLTWAFSRWEAKRRSTAHAKTSSSNEAARSEGARLLMKNARLRAEARLRDILPMDAESPGESFVALAKLERELLAPYPENFTHSVPTELGPGV